MSGKKNNRGPMEEISTSVEAAENAIFPDAGVVLTSGDESSTAENSPLPAAMAGKPIDQKSPAEWAYERIILYIQKFEEQLDAEHEVVMGFVGGDTGTMHIQGMGFFAPDLITFYGSDETGTKTQMVQHVSQLSVALKAARKPDETVEAARIGFLLNNGIEKKDKA